MHAPVAHTHPRSTPPNRHERLSMRVMDDEGFQVTQLVETWLRRLHVVAAVNATPAANGTSASPSVNGTASNSNATAAAPDAPALPEADDSAAALTGEDIGWTILIGGFVIFTSIFTCSVVCVLRGTGTIPKNRIMRRICMITDG
jgi:hypothetical protein